MFKDLAKKFQGMNGFRKPKKLTRAQEERQQQAQAFGDEYKALCAKHKLQLRPIINHGQDGSTTPDMVLVAYEPPQLKNWAQASKENLEVQKKCRHLNVGENCKTCGVRLADQDTSGTGVTPEFIKVKEERIKAYEEKEKKENEEVA